MCFARCWYLRSYPVGRLRPAAGSKENYDALTYSSSVGFWILRLHPLFGAKSPVECDFMLARSDCLLLLRLFCLFLTQNPSIRIESHLGDVFIHNEFELLRLELHRRHKSLVIFDPNITPQMLVSRYCRDDNI